jgi:hypothetical protein
MKKNPCHFAPCPIVFASSNRHCVISRWCSHIGECYHRQPHLNWFGFKSCYFLWGYGDNCDSCKRWYLSWLVHTKHVFPSSCGGFQMSTLTSGWVFSSMCQHGVGSKGHRRSLLLVLNTFYRQRVLMALWCAYVVFILRRVVAVGEGPSRLGVLSRGPPFPYLICIYKIKWFW